jgi:hypothetical protein
LVLIRRCWSSLQLSIVWNDSRCLSWWERVNWTCHKPISLRMDERMCHDQCVQTGRIFAYWAIVFFWQFLEKCFALK